MELRDILRGAKGELIKRGWCQKDMTDPGGRVCLSGAVASATGYLTWREDGEAWLGYSDSDEHFWWKYTLDTLHLSTHLPVPVWNDMQGRTLDEVIALIDSAIVELDAREGRQDGREHEATHTGVLAV